MGSADEVMIQATELNRTMRVSPASYCFHVDMELSSLVHSLSLTLGSICLRQSCCTGWWLIDMVHTEQQLQLTSILMPGRAARIRCRLLCCLTSGIELEIRS